MWISVKSHFLTEFIKLFDFLFFAVEIAFVYIKKILFLLSFVFEQK